MTAELAKRDDDFNNMFGIQGLWTTLNLSTQEGVSQLAKALDFTNPKLDDVINTEIRIVHIMVRDMEGKPSDEGEIQDYMGIVLICDDGRCYFTGSKGIKQSIFLGYLRRGKPPWNPPLRAIVKQRAFKLQDGNPGRTYYLEFPGEPEAKKVAKG